MNGAMWWWITAVLLVGCHGTSPTDTPDAPPDTSTEMGLNVLFVSNPTTIPGMVDPSRQLSITSAILRPAFLRVIGDAGVGDTRTTELQFDFSWDDSHTPTPLHFADAPSGIYSNLSAEIDALFIDYAYEVRGSVNVAGTQHDFYIHDRDRFDVSIDSLHVELDAGGSADVTLSVDFTEALKQVDYTKLSSDPLDMDTGDGQMDDFRDKLKHGFSVDGHGDGGPG
jgi:hypothetical protein